MQGCEFLKYFKSTGEVFMAKKKKTTAKRRTGVRVAKKKTAGKKRKSGLSQQTYTLSEELQEVVGAKKLTRPQIVKKMWVYIKAHKCQDTKNRRMIVPDRKLAAVIGSRPIDMLKLAGHLNKHIK
jgi:chromatin remodeling complex protein RSC6